MTYRPQQPESLSLPPHLAGLQTEAMALLQQGRPHEAEAPVRRLLTQRPDDIFTNTMLGDCLRLQGRAAEAEAIYLSVLQKRTDAAVYNNLGTVQRAQGKLDAAMASYRIALETAPDLAAAHTNLGTILARQGHLEEAEARCREAVRLAPDNAGCVGNLGIVLQGQGRLDEAAPLLERALALQPQSVGAYQTLCRLRIQQQRYADAVALMKRAVALQPGNAALYNGLGRSHLLNREPDAAVSCFRQAIAIAPDFAAAHANLAEALTHQNLLSSAEDACRTALRLSPENPTAHINLVLILLRQKRRDEAQRAVQQVLELPTTSLDDRNNLAAILGKCGRYAEAQVVMEATLALYPEDPMCNVNLAVNDLNLKRYPRAQDRLERVIARHPNHIEAHTYLATLLLQQGDFERGWAEYEWRKQVTRPLRQAGKPRWDGSPFPGKTLLISTEQGFGDTIQFVRFLPEVKARGGRVVVEYRPGLGALLQRAGGIDQLVPLREGYQTPDVPFDLHVALMSLPHVMGMGGRLFTAAVPYLSADPEKVETWRQRLAGDPGFKVGLVWAGSPTYAGDAQRSFDLDTYSPLAELPGVSLYSLQKGAAALQREQSAWKLKLTDLGQALDDFDATAAVIMNLDLIISVDTSVAHLAGALGRPVWTLSRYGGDWRWFPDRNDTPWYPTMRLFHQPRQDDWTTVIANVCRELDAEIN